MRTVVLLALLCVGVNGESDIEKTADCIVDGGAAVDELMDASIYIWAATKRCPTSALNCEIDTTAAVESVLAMIKIIVKVSTQCGDLHNRHSECGEAALDLTHSVAGISSAAGSLYKKCPVFGNDKVVPTHSWHHAGPAMCVVDLKDTFRSLFKAIKGFMGIKKKCKDPHSKKCRSNTLKIISSLVGLGEYTAGVIGHCTKIGDHANCASEAGRLVHHLMNLAKAGTDMARKCHKKEEEEAVPTLPPPPTVVEVPVTIDVGSRLYADEGRQGKDGPANLILAAFLPITGIVSFVGGRFYAIRRSERRTQSREITPEEQTMF